MEKRKKKLKFEDLKIAEVFAEDTSEARQSLDNRQRILAKMIARVYLEEQSAKRKAPDEFTEAENGHPLD